MVSQDTFYPLEWIVQKITYVNNLGQYLQINKNCRFEMDFVLPMDKREGVYWITKLCFFRRGTINLQTGESQRVKPLEFMDSVDDIFLVGTW